MIARNKTYHGVSIGILMVDSRFQRFSGDIGNARTWDFPVQYSVVRGATPAQMINLASSQVLEPLLDAAEQLVADGVDAISTTCGFLGLYQNELCERLNVPVATSALLQVPMVERLIGEGRRVGVLTYSQPALNSAHLEAVGVAADTPVVGLPEDSSFFQWIMQGRNDVPFEQLREDVIACACALIDKHPEVGAIVSECTNLTPFAADIASSTGLPVFDMVTLMNWFQQGICPRRFSQT